MDSKNQNYIQSNIKNFAGTSAGAITALMLAVGFTSKEIYDTMYHIDYDTFFENPIDKVIDEIKDFNISHFVDYWNYVTDIVKHYGLNKGNKFKDFLINEVMIKKGFDADTTFSKLFNENGHSLFVYSLNVTTNSLECFSTFKESIVNSKATPDFNIVDAVTASMALPIVFQPRYFEINDSVNIFVDGGEVLNYPIKFMDEEKYVNFNTIGFSLNKEKHYSKEVDSIIKLTIAEIGAIYNAQVLEGYSDPNISDRTVYLDTSMCSVIDFHMKKEVKDEIINNAYETTKEWLKVNSIKN